MAYNIDSKHMLALQLFIQQVHEYTIRYMTLINLYIRIIWSINYHIVYKRKFHQQISFWNKLCDRLCAVWIYYYLDIELFTQTKFRYNFKLWNRIKLNFYYILKYLFVTLIDKLLTNTYHNPYEHHYTIRSDGCKTIVVCPIDMWGLPLKNRGT